MLRIRLENVYLTLLNREVNFAPFWFTLYSFVPLNLPELYVPIFKFTVAIFAHFSLEKPSPIIIINNITYAFSIAENTEWGKKLPRFGVSLWPGCSCHIIVGSDGYKISSCICNRKHRNWKLFSMGVMWRSALINKMWRWRKRERWVTRRRSRRWPLSDMD